jgi:Family of unknown function (DUF6599)
MEGQHFLLTKKYPRSVIASPDRYVPPSPVLLDGIKGHNIKENYLAGKPRPLGRGAFIQFRARQSPPWRTLMQTFARAFVIPFLISIFICSQALSKEVPVESLLPRKLPEGWRQIGSPQVYIRKTLFNRINGQAELFFKYGFQKSVFTLYQNKSKAKDQIEFDLFDMGNALQGFGIFSRFRSEDRSAGVGSESYLEDTSLLFYRGRYFVMLYATEADSSILTRLAKTISSEIPDSSPPPKEIDYFPKNGLKPGSIEYYPEGLLGYQFFKRGFQGVYLEKAGAQDNPRGEDRGIHLFLAIFDNSQDAEDALRTYKNSLSKKGKIDSTAPARFGSDGLKGEDPNRGKVMVVQKGFYLLGVVGFEKKEDGENLLAEFMREVK